MTRNKRKKGIIIVVISLFLLTILAVSFYFFLGKSEKDFIIKDNVTVITEEMSKKEQPLEVREDEIVFEYNPHYEKGDVIVSGIIDTAPAGFIRIVEDVENEDGLYIVETKNGYLTDVFEKLDVTKTFLLTADGVKDISTKNIADRNANSTSLCADLASKTVPYALFWGESALSYLDNDTDYQFAREFEFDIEQGITVKGEVGFSIVLEVDLSIEDGDIFFEIVAKSETGGELFVGYSAEEIFEFEKELFSKNLPNIQFFIGFVPVVITNELTANVEGKVSLEGEIGTSFAVKASNETGFSYSSETNEIEEIKNSKYQTDGLQWNTEAKVAGESSIGIRLHLVTKLYDSTGADISIGVEGTIEGELKAYYEEEVETIKHIGSLDLAIGPTIQGSIVVSVPIIDKKLVDKPIFEVKLSPFWEKHWDSGENREDQLAESKKEAIFTADVNMEEVKRLLQNVNLTNTYTTQWFQINAASHPEFEFSYPDNWRVISNNVGGLSYDGNPCEEIVLINERGLRIIYIDSPRSDSSGCYLATVTKLADATLDLSRYMDGDESEIGKFMVAEVIVEDSSYYVLMEEKYAGQEIEMAKYEDFTNVYDEFFFSYHCAIAFFAQASNGHQTEQDVAEIISILASFQKTY